MFFWYIFVILCTVKGWTLVRLNDVMVMYVFAWSIAFHWLFAQNLLSLHKNPQTQKLIYKFKSSTAEGYGLCSFFDFLADYKDIWRVMLLLVECLRKVDKLLCIWFSYTHSLNLYTFITSFLFNPIAMMALHILVSLAYL